MAEIEIEESPEDRSRSIARAKVLAEQFLKDTKAETDLTQMRAACHVLLTLWKEIDPTIEDIKVQVLFDRLTEQ